MYSSLRQDISQLENSFAAREEGGSGEVQDQETLRLFLKVWNQAPAEWKAKCDVPKAIEQQPHRDRVRVDLWSEAPITVPSIVLAQLRIWDGNPSAFLTLGVPFSFDESDNSFTRMFPFMDYVEGNATPIQNIRCRLVRMGMHDLMTRLKCSQLRPDSEAEDEFARRVQCIGDRREMGQKVKRWATVGGKYVSLSQDFGGWGAMICMPEDISKAKLERIPSHGEIRDNAIACLKRRGIQDKTKDDIQMCYKVAEKIWKAMRADVDSNFLEQTPVIRNDQPSKKRKRKDRAIDSDTRRICRESNVAGNTLEDTLAITGPTINFAIEPVLKRASSDT